jgi:hypothetical protein
MNGFNGEISDLVNGYEGKTIGKILLCKDDGYKTIVCDYKVGTNPLENNDPSISTSQNLFAYKIVEQNKKSGNLIKRAYDDKGRVKIVLNCESDDIKATRKINELFSAYLTVYNEENYLQDESLKIKPSEELLLGDIKNMDFFKQKGLVKMVKKPRDVTSLLDQNVFSSEPFYTVGDGVSDRGNDKYAR